MKTEELVKSEFDVSMVPLGGGAISELSMMGLTLRRYKSLMSSSSALKNSYKLFVNRPQSKVKNAFSQDIASYSMIGNAPYVIIGNDIELRVTQLFLNAVYENNALGKIVGSIENINLNTLNQFYIPLAGINYRYASILQAYKILTDTLVKNLINELDKAKFIFIQQYLRLVIHYYVLEAYQPNVFQDNNISVIQSWADLIDLAIDENVEDVTNVGEITRKQVLDMYAYILSNRNSMMATINKLKVLQYDI